MIEALRQLAEHPIAERERRAAFALAAAILLAAAALLLLSAGGSIQPAPAPTTASQGRAASPAPPLPAPSRGAEAAATRFLHGYLPFLYGRGGARGIRGAAPRLLGRLIGTRLRVPPAARERRPRVEALRVHRIAAGRAALTAQIADGDLAGYPIELVLARRAGRWLVVAVGVE